MMGIESGAQVTPVSVTQGEVRGVKSSRSRGTKIQEVSHAVCVQSHPALGLTVGKPWSQGQTGVPDSSHGSNCLALRP